MARYTHPQPTVHRTQTVRPRPPTVDTTHTDEEDTPVNTSQDLQVEQAEPEPAPRGTVHEAEVAVASGSGLDQVHQGAQADQEAPNAPAPLDHNTPPPEGVPEPPPVIDRTTVVKQARTFIDDAVAVYNWKLTPADSNGIDMRLVQLFDEGNTNAEDLADVVATDLGMKPEWSEGGPTMMKITATQNPTPPQQ
jgi:hypothetical protein